MSGLVSYIDQAAMLLNFTSFERQRITLNHCLQKWACISILLSQ